MSRKNQYVNEFKEQVTQLAQVMSGVSELVDTYFDRGYNGGGSDEIVDADISSTGLTASDIVDLVTLGQQLGNLQHNSIVIQGDYGATINVARTDF